MSCGHNRRSAVIQDPLHVVRIAASGNPIQVGCRCLPKHDASEGFRIKTHVFGDQWPNFSWSEVETRVGSVRRRRQTNKELGGGIASFLDDFHPLVEVEARIAGTIDEVPSGTAVRVVELNPNKIEGRILNCITQLWVRNGALGRTGDIELPLGVMRKVPAKTVDHRSITWNG